MDRSYGQKLFEKQLKDQEVIELLNSTDGSALFQVKQDVENQLIDDYERELMDRFYNIVPQEIKNPCPPEKSFSEFRDEMTRVNEKVYKKIVKQGEGAEVDLERMTVSYGYEMFLEGAVDPFDSSLLNKKPGVVNVKEGIEPTPGSYLALATMKKGEEAVFWIHHGLMFGKLGCPPRVPASADILFSAKIIEIEDPNGGTENVEDEENRINKSFKNLWKEAAKSHKNASDHFQLGNYSRAIDIYRKWIKKLENAGMKSDEEEEKQKQMLIKMYQNVCVCYNKIEKPEKTCVMMRELEKLTPIGDNPKALYAKAKANMLLNNFKEARRYFMIADRLTPTDTSISKALHELNRRETKKAQYEKETEELARKFHEEALEMKEENRKKEEERRKEKEELNQHLEKFKEKLEGKIVNLKNDDEIDNLCISTDNFTHYHIELAEEICQQHQVQLKGTEFINGNEKIYYLSK